MATCEEIRAKIILYLDNELQEAERAAFKTHITSCIACREALAEEREFTQKLRTVGPLYNVPVELQKRIEQIVGEATQQRRPPLVSRARWLAAATVTLLAILIGAVWYITRSRPQALSELAVTAVDTHLRRMRGQLPLEIITNSSQQVSEWFIGKVPFNLKLPNYEAAPGQQKPYELEGARLVGFKQDYAAYVSYRMNRKLVSLLVTSGTAAQPSGGEEIVSRGITFHYQSSKGLKVITWSDRGLTYALISDFEERGQRSCMVCHQEAESKQFIEGLKNKN